MGDMGSYGGLGGMYGGLGGLGGMGMYGGYGMGIGMGMNQDSSVFRAMQMMQSFSMVVSGMTQVVGSVEQNT
jgi:peroxin-13